MASALEESISGSRTEKNIRPTINSYMDGSANAMAKMAEMIGNDSLSGIYNERAHKLRSFVHEKLWDEEDQFFKVLCPDGNLADVREAIGYIPWYFKLPIDSEKYAEAWKQKNDPKGFLAPFGLTTAEQRHPEFRTHGTGTSEWDGEVWPFASTQTLKGMANLLTDYENHSMTKKDYFRELKKFAIAHKNDGAPFIGEYFDEQTNVHLHGDKPRSVHYNHSVFVDLIINDLVGLKPRADDKIEIHPLIPENQWDWFCLDNIKYHGQILTILWDKTGDKYERGEGFLVFMNGEEIYRSGSLSPALIRMSEN